MALDYVATIQREASGVLRAYEVDRSGRVPWSDRWSVGSVARHVANAHHVVAQIIEDRPTADFGLFDKLKTPPKDDPGFPAWFATGTEALCAALRATDPSDACWSVHPDDPSVGFWLRHMAHETLIHRWDAEAGAGLPVAPIEPGLAADGIDEYLTLYVPVVRRMHRSPAGPSVHITCSDLAADWHVALDEPGRCRVTPSAAPADSTLSGSAEGLLLLLWRRQELREVDARLAGDAAFLERRDELIPPA